MIRALSRPLHFNRPAISFSTHVLHYTATPQKSEDRTSPEEPRDIFEDTPAEYSAVPQELPEATVEGLVQEKNFARANTLREQLQRRGVGIEPSASFFAAARDVVETRGSLETFAEWVSLLPERPLDAGATLLALDATIAHLLQSAEENAEYTKALAMLLAQKGYAEVVRNKVLPTLSRFTKYEDFTALFHAVEQRSIEFLRSKQASAAIAYPATEENTSDIFDNSEDDYSTFAITITQSPSTPVSSVQTLEGLIRSGQVLRASQVLEELRSIGAEIPKSPIYSFAANRLLRNYDTRDEIDQYQLWFELVPPVDQNPNHAHLSQLTGYLLNQHRPNLQLIAEFSLFCSRNGYISLLERTLPVIIRYTHVDFSREQLTLWEENLRGWLSQRNYPERDIKGWEARIRGEAIRAYRHAGRYIEVSSIVRRSYETDTRLPYSLFRFLIRKWERDFGSQSMADLQIVKDVRDAWFPSPPQSYEDPRSAGTQSDEQASSAGPTQELALLVEQGQYAEAESMRETMLRHGHIIHPSAIYFQAALAALNAESSSDRARNFHHWMDLVAEAGAGESQRSLESLADRVCQESADRTLTMLFALHCARKGFFDIVRDRYIFHNIICGRSVTVPSVLKFLEKLGKELDRRHLSRYPGHIPPSQLMYAEAVAISAKARRLSLALQLTRVLDKVQKTSIIANADASCTSQRGVDFLEFAQNLETRDTWPAQEISIPTLLRFLRRVFIPATSTAFWIPPPREEDLHKYVLLLEKFGRSSAIKMLNNRAMRSHPTHSAIWARTIMLHAAREGAYDRVLCLFANYFYLVGVYRRGIKEVFERRKGDWRFMQPRLEGRIHPQPADVAIVWDALVNKLREEKEPWIPLGHLYRHFIGTVRVSKGVWTRNPVTAAGRTIVPYHPPPNQFTDESFTRFIAAFCQYMSPKWALTVFKHMIDLGFNPTIAQLRRVACEFASRNQVGGALGMLDYMLLHKERYGERDILEAYATVLKAFLYMKCLEGGEQTELRLKEGLGYQPGLGLHKRLDTNLASLENLRKELDVNG